MATGPNKEVKLTLSVETLGEADIKALKTAIESLASGGSAAAPEFQRLADQIDRLADQNDALATFKRLSDEVAELAVKQDTAATKAADLKTALEAQIATVTQVREKQEQANQALLEAQVSYAKAGAEIKAYKAQVAAADKDTKDYRDTLVGLVNAQAAEQAKLIGLRADQKAANAEVSEAVAAQSKLETAYRNTTKSADTISASLTKQTQALQAAAVAAEELGASTTDVAASEAALVRSFNEAGAAAELLRQNISAAGAAARALSEQQVFEKALQDAQKLRDAAEYVRFWEQALTEAAAAERALQAATAASNWQAEADSIVVAAHAAQELAKQTNVAAAAARELAEQAAFEKAAADSQKLIKAAEYVRFWEQALQEGGTEAQKTAAAAVAAAERIEQAFKTVGVRSVEALNAEIATLRAAMGTLQEHATSTGSALSGAFTQGQSKIAALERDIRELNGTLTTTDRLAGLLKNSLGQIAAGNLIADGVGYLVNKVKELAAAFVTTIAEQQKLSRALNAIYKDSNLAASQMEFLRQTAVTAGVAVGGIQQSFVKFSAATASANIPLQQSNELFAALVKAGGTLGLSADSVAGSLDALAQMASKGTVSMEELRQQLGDRLPGALSLVAKGLGLTDSQLIKLVESGGLAARDLFPALTSALKTMQGEVSGVTPAWENFKNALTGAAQAAGDSGWANILTVALRGLAVVLGALVIPLSGFSEIVLTTARSIGILAGAVVTGTNPIKALGEEITNAAKRQEKLVQAFGVAAGVIDASTVATQKNTAAQQTNANSIGVAVAGTEKLREVTVATAEGQQALQAAMGVTAATYVKAREALDSAIASAEKQAETAAKNVKAAQDEGAALVTLAKLRGDDRAELEASVKAKELDLAAQEKHTLAKQREAELLRVEKALLIELNPQRKLNQQQLDDETKKLDLKIQKAEAEAAQSKATLSNLKLEVAARQSAVKTYGDQSGALDQLAKAAAATQAAFISVSRAFAEGRATSDQLRAADIAAAQARNQYNDALKDSVAKIQAVASVEQAKINVQMAGLTVSQNAYNLLAQASKASGDYAMAIYYEIEAKKVQIQITNLQAQAKKIEAEYELKAVDAMRKELEAQGPLTDAKKAELEVRTLNAKAKLIEAGASADVVRALEREVTAIRNRASAAEYHNGVLQDSTRATRESTSAIDSNTDSLNRNASASERAAEAERKRLNVDKEGFSTDKEGKRITTGGQLKIPEGYYFDAEAANRDARFTSGQSDGSEFIKPIGGFKLLDNSRREWAGAFGGSGVSSSLGGSSPGYVMPAPTPAPPPPPVSTSSHTVTVNLNGSATTINTASQADAVALARLMKSLEQAAGTAQ